jgi:hypothetical protein
LRMQVPSTRRKRDREPKPLTASDYCYSGRLHSRSYDLNLQP